MDRGVEKIFLLVMVAAVVAMTLIIVRMYWRGYRGAPVRPTRRTLLVAAVCALIAVGSAIVVLAV